jgi:hypothetical protein
MLPILEVKMTEWKNWVEQVLDLSVRINTANSFGALHIVVGDGNMDDENIEFCLKQPEITLEEIKLAEDLLSSEIELRAFSYWLSDYAEARALLATLNHYP